MNIKLKFYLDKEATPNFKLDWQGELKDLNDKFNSSQMCSLAVQSVRGSDRKTENDINYVEDKMSLILLLLSFQN